jgi:hypothetical protein
MARLVDSIVANTFLPLSGPGSQWRHRFTAHGTLDGVRHLARVDHELVSAPVTHDRSAGKGSTRHACSSRWRRWAEASAGRPWIASRHARGRLGRIAEEHATS